MEESRLQKLRIFEARLVELHEHLKAAEAIFQTDPLGDDGVNFQREGISAALMAIQDFLRAEGFEAHIRGPIRSMIGALDDADEGRKNPILERRTQGVCQRRSKIGPKGGVKLGHLM